MNPNPPQPGQIGAMCTDGSQCVSGICASESGQSFCTASCDPNLANSCPAGTICEASGSEHYCAPKGLNGSSSGGCSAAPGARPTGPSLVVLAVLLFALGLRRRLGF
jgi:uncharacterized protein (TIGR03382 family)